MKIKIKFLVSVLLLGIFLVGCGKSGNLKEGDCILNVSLNQEQLPQSFELLGENIKDEYEIKVCLENINSERLYYIYLNAQNGYKQKAKLNPGVYKINYETHNLANIHGMKIELQEENVQLTREKNTDLVVNITNTKEAEAWIQNAQPTPDILKEDRFSRKVQLNGEIIDLQTILEVLPFSPAKKNTEFVKPYETLEVFNSDYGIRVTMQNQSAEGLPWEKCQISSVAFGRNVVVLGGGVTIGCEITEVCHAQDGIYGKPSSLKGSVFLGLDIDTTSAEYLDSESGDKITLEFLPNGICIDDIQYEFAVFE